MRYILLFLLFIIPLGSFAASPVSNVGTSKVVEGLLSVENRAGFTEDGESASNDKRLRIRQHLDYGFTDWYALRLIVAENKNRGDNIEYSGLTIENRFQVWEKDVDGWDGGFRLIFGYADGANTPHEIDVRFMSEVPFDNDWAWRHNTVLEHDIGENSVDGIALEFRNALYKKLDFQTDSIKNLQLGVEAFNDFGRLNHLNGFATQDHQIGPSVKMSFYNGIYLQAGYRRGVSRGSVDNLIKLFVGKKF